LLAIRLRAESSIDPHGHYRASGWLSQGIRFRVVKSREESRSRNESPIDDDPAAFEGGAVNVQQQHILERKPLHAPDPQIAACIRNEKHDSDDSEQKQVDDSQADAGEFFQHRRAFLSRYAHDAGSS
jgi:hypothetical protein